MKLLGYDTIASLLYPDRQDSLWRNWCGEYDIWRRMGHSMENIAIERMYWEHHKLS